MPVKAPTDLSALPDKPSASYRAEVWRLACWVVRIMPLGLARRLGRLLVRLYCRFRPERQEVVVRNLLPGLGNDRAAAERAARALFSNFADKLIDLWRYENGQPVVGIAWSGWEHLAAAQSKGQGVLLVTAHLGNWEFGAPFLIQRGIRLLVLTQPEPGNLTALRQASRARWGIETLVVGQDAFAFVEVIKRLQQGAMVALLLDRPWPATAVTVELFGRPFPASIAAAELARASGCAILPVYILQEKSGYSAHALPAVAYDRQALGTREARRELTQQILRVLEPAIQQHLDQWYHFVPVWPEQQPPAPVNAEGTPAPKVMA